MTFVSSAGIFIPLKEKGGRENIRSLPQNEKERFVINVMSVPYNLMTEHLKNVKDKKKLNRFGEKGVGW